MAFVATESLNLWHQYCRHYYLSCALGTLDADGVRVQNAAGIFASEALAIRWARDRVPNKIFRSEPIWRDPAVWSTVMSALGPSVLPSVTMATGVASDAFSDLPTFRNFYAHRCRDTAMRTRDLARAYMLSLRLHPSEILLSRKASSNVSVITDWLDDIYAAVDLTVD